MWGSSIQEMVGNVIGRSIYGVVVIDGSFCSRFYGMLLLAQHISCTSTACLGMIPEHYHVRHTFSEFSNRHGMSAAVVILQSGISF